MIGHLEYVVFFAAVALPGIPVGRALFGRHPAALVAGAVLGYGLSTIAFWTAIALGAATRVELAAAWAAACIAGWIAGRFVRPVRIFAWSRGDSVALVSVLLLTLAIALPPFARVGQPLPNGQRLYRAYFTADFIWHMALTAEVAKFQLPLRNPYLAQEPIHYYWGYFVVPAVAAERGPAALRSIEARLKDNAIAVGLLFAAVLFLLARLAVPRPAAAAIGVSMALLASSAEGLYETWRMWHQGVPLWYLTQTNIDAVANWQFHGLRVDGLQRCLWYVPQHMMGYTSGVVALVIGCCGGIAAPVSVILAAGAALAVSVLCNPLVGGMFALGYAGTILVDAARARALLRVPLHGLAALPVLAAIGWCYGNHMLDGAGHALTFGLHGLARNAPLQSLAVSLGPVLAAALAGALLPIGSAPLAASVPALIMIPLSLALMHYVSLDVDAAYIGFRAGHILIAAAVMLLARASMGLFAGRLRAVTAVLLAVLLLVGAPTTAIDWYNARDTDNRLPSIGGFRWTIGVTRAEQEAFRWIRRATPRTAVVQMEPVVRGRETWSQIPSFAERRMAAGLPISLLHVPAYDERSNEVQRMYATEDATEARRIAEHLGIDYVYVDTVERGAYPRGMQKFDLHPELFAPVFRNLEVTIYSAR